MFIQRAVGDRSATLRTGLLLVVFLGLFALGIISPWRSLFFTMGGLILVGSFMVMYAQRAVLPEPPPPPEPEPEDEVSEVEEELVAVEDAVRQISVAEEVSVPVQKPVHSHCPHCGRELAEDFGFCPGCGQETTEVQKCEHCGYLQFIPIDSDTRYCVQCGKTIRCLKL
jgi:hypothetical protein